MRTYMSPTNRTLHDIETRNRIKRIIERYRNLLERCKEDKCPEKE